MRLTVATAAPVTILVAPGPIEVVQTRRLQAIFVFGIGHRSVHHGLFVARLVIAKISVLVQRLADARDVAVAENAKAAGEKALLDAIAFGVLVFQKLDDRLGHGQADGGM